MGFTHTLSQFKLSPFSQSSLLCQYPPLILSFWQSDTFLFLKIDSTRSAYRAYGFRDRIVKQLFALLAYILIRASEGTYGGLLLRSVFRMTGTLVISVTS